MQELCLLSLEQAGVIALQPSGLLFWTHVGAGGADNRVEAEGVFVPLSSDPPADSPELALAARLASEVQKADCFTPQLADAVDEVLLEISSSDAYRVDRQRLSESRSGWVYVTVTPQGEFSHFQGFESFAAVVTWPLGSGN
ncbi:MAG: hypothetical protein GYB33_11880 [Gammaproteobacteria bacterium]|nr:hypothetical protein [Gammaproteobacteria bacterium]